MIQTKIEIDKTRNRIKMSISLVDTLLCKCKQSPVNLKHACAIMKGNRIITIATNTHRNSWKNQPVFGLHAEQQAIVQFLTMMNLSSHLYVNNRCEWTCRDSRVKRCMKKYTLVVIRDRLNNSKPCQQCCQLMREVGIRKVIYSNSNNEMVNEYVRDMECNHQTHGTKRMLRGR